MLSSSLQTAVLSAVAAVILASPLLAQPGIRIDNISVTEGNAGTTQAVLNLTLTAPGDGLVTVDLGSSPGGPAATGGAACGGDVDYVQPSGTVQFDPGDVSQSVSVTVCGDVTDENNEIFRVDLLNPVGATLADLRGRITILDDDAPAPPPSTLPQIRIDNISVGETNTGGTKGDLTVTLTTPSDEVVTVDYGSSPGSPAATGGAECGGDVDFFLPPGTVRFDPGVVSQKIRVFVCGDVADENDEIMRADLLNPVGATLADLRGRVTIVDDDPQPTVSILDTTITELAPGGITASFTLALSADSGHVVAVDFATVPGTATAGTACGPGVDYRTTTGRVGFNPGSQFQAMGVGICDDALTESPETFQVVLSNPANATLGDAQGQGTITDDDATPTVSIFDKTIAEGTGSNTLAVFRVILSAPAPSQVVTVGFSGSPAGASRGSSCEPNVDFVLAPGTVTFDPGQRIQSVLATICGDTVDEPDETFRVILSNPVNASLANGTGNGTITNDDAPPPPSLTLSVAGVTVLEGDVGQNPVTFTGTLSRPAPLDFVLAPAAGQISSVAPGEARPTDGNACTTAGVDFLNAVAPVPIAVDQTTFTFNVVVCHDTRNETTERVKVTIPTLTTPMGVIGITTTLEIRDDDPPPRRRRP